MPHDSNDPYTYPGTQVLRNKPDIRHEAALRKFEYEQATSRTEELHERPIAGKFDLDHLKSIHRHLFQDVYDWAGKARTVSISKDGDMFAVPSFIESQGRRLSAALAEEQHLKGLSKPQFVERMTDHYAEWNALHPFREGNGRSLREFFGQLTREAGYELDQTYIERHKEQWNLASKHSFHGNLEPLKQFFDQAIHDGRPELNLAGKKTESALRAIGKNRDSLALMERSYSSADALKQTQIQAARGMLERMEAAVKGGTAEVRLSVEKNTPQVAQGALSMIRPSIQALERSGLSVQHELRQQWQAEGVQAEHGHERSAR